MATLGSRSRPRRRRIPTSVGKPRGVLHPRVQQVGPDHFGIVCFDCAKVRSKFLLADFYGRLLLPPTLVAHTRPALDAAVAQIRQAFAQHQLQDGLIAIERTGRYHRLVQRTFAAAGFETRILHPFVTKQYRQPVDPGNKTDDADLAAIHRATVTGCALLEATRDEAWTSLQLLVRHRRDLVRKGAALNCQIRDHLEAALPGYAACFDKLWESSVPWHLLRHYPTARQLQEAGVTALCHSLRQAGIRFQQRTLQTVVDWALQAAPGDVAASQHLRIALALYDDRQHKPRKFRPWNAISPVTSCRPPTCSCFPFLASTWSAPPSSGVRWGPSRTTPTPSLSPVGPAYVPPGTRATKSTTLMVRWCATVTMPSAPPSSPSPTT